MFTQGEVLLTRLIYRSWLLALMLLPTAVVCGCGAGSRQKAGSSQPSYFAFVAAQLKLQERNSREAIASLRTAIEKDAQSVYLRLELARLYRRLGEFEQARSELEQAIRIAPDDAQVYMGGQWFPATESASLIQYDDNRFEMDAPSPASGERAKGVLTVKDKEHGLSFAVQDFWQSYPSGISISPSEISVDLLPGDVPAATPVHA